MHSLFLFAAAGQTENPVQEITRTFDWEPRLFFSQVVLFIIVAFVLSKFAYGPILAMLDGRKKLITEGLANAEKIKQELARTEAMQKEVLDKANVQATKMIEEAREAAAKVRETETQKAIAEAAQIIAKAREASALEHARMLAELKHEVGTLVAKTTSIVAGKILTADDQQRLAEETRRQLAA
jgi:F-type H+-transporting ATPase subunit b